MPASLNTQEIKNLLEKIYPELKNLVNIKVDKYRIAIQLPNQLIKNQTPIDWFNQNLISDIKNSNSEIQIIPTYYKDKKDGSLILNLTSTNQNSDTLYKNIEITLNSKKSEIQLRQEQELIAKEEEEKRINRILEEELENFSNTSTEINHKISIEIKKGFLKKKPTEDDLEKMLDDAYDECKKESSNSEQKKEESSYLKQQQEIFDYIHSTLLPRLEKKIKESSNSKQPMEEGYYQVHLLLAILLISRLLTSLMQKGNLPEIFFSLLNQMNEESSNLEHLKAISKTLLPFLQQKIKENFNPEQQQTIFVYIRYILLPYLEEKIKATEEISTLELQRELLLYIGNELLPSLKHPIKENLNPVEKPKENSSNTAQQKENAEKQQVSLKSEEQEKTSQFSKKEENIQKKESSEISKNEGNKKTTAVVDANSVAKIEKASTDKIKKLLNIFPTMQNEFRNIQTKDHYFIIVFNNQNIEKIKEEFEKIRKNLLFKMNGIKTKFAEIRNNFAIYLHSEDKNSEKVKAILRQILEILHAENKIKSNPEILAQSMQSLFNEMNSQKEIPNDNKQYVVQ